MKLTEHFSLSEFIRDGDQPPAEVVDCLRALCVNVLEPIRADFGPVQITSGWRPGYVTDVGKVSQHDRGEAADIRASRVSSWSIYSWLLLRPNIDFDQAICYTNSRHLHLSFTQRRANRRQFLVRTENGYTTWDAFKSGGD